MSAPIKKQFDYYVTNLNWGDGTPIEYVSKPKLFDRSFNFEHNYERPGFYTITGLVFKYSLLFLNFSSQKNEVIVGSATTNEFPGMGQTASYTIFKIGAEFIEQNNARRRYFKSYLDQSNIKHLSRFCLLCRTWH